LYYYLWIKLYFLRAKGRNYLEMRSEKIIFLQSVDKFVTRNSVESFLIQDFSLLLQ